MTTAPTFDLRAKTLVSGMAINETRFHALVKLYLHSVDASNPDFFFFDKNVSFDVVRETRGFQSKNLIAYSCASYEHE